MFERLMVVAIALVMVCGIAQAAKDVSFTEVTRPSLSITFNRQVKVNGTATYYPVIVTGVCIAGAEDGSERRVVYSQAFGSGSNTKYTAKQIYSALPVQLRQVLKGLYLEAIGNDVSE